MSEHGQKLHLAALRLSCGLLKVLGAERRENELLVRISQLRVPTRLLGERDSIVREWTMQR
jgi:hypothetical protein